MTAPISDFWLNGWGPALTIAAPTLVAVYGNPTPSASRQLNGATGSNTVSCVVSWAAGDLLIVSYGGEAGGSLTGAVPTASGLTFSRISGMPLDASNSNGAFLDAHQATAAGAGTNVTLTVTLTGGNAGQNNDVLVYRFSGSGGVGVVSTTANSTASTDTVGTVALTTSQDHSAVVYHDVDWTPVSQTAPTFSTATAGPYTTEHFIFVSGAFAAYAGVHTDSGLAGAKTIGLTSGSGMRNTRYAVEVKGIPTSGPVDTGSVAPVGTGSMDLPGAITEVGALAGSGSASASMGGFSAESDSLNATATATGAVASSQNQAGGLSASGSASSALPGVDSTTTNITAAAVATTALVPSGDTVPGNLVAAGIGSQVLIVFDGITGTLAGSASATQSVSSATPTTTGSLAATAVGTTAFGSGSGSYPVASAASVTTISAAVTGWTINVSSASAGDLRIVNLGVRNNTTWTTPSGWTQITSVNAGGVGQLVVFTKIVDSGDAANTTVAFTSGVANVGSAQCRTITGSDTGVALEVATSNSGGIPGTTADPPSLSPSWGSAQTLWLAYMATAASGATTSAAPTGYSDFTFTNVAAGGSSGGTGSASRQLTATSDDPTAFTSTADRWWMAATVAVKPTAGGSAGVTEVGSLAATGTGSQALSTSGVTSGSLSATATGAQALAVSPVTVTGALSASATGSSAISPAQTDIGALAAAATATETLTRGASTVSGSLAASASASSAIAPQQTEPGSLAATGTGTSLLSGALTVSAALAGTGTASADLNGSAGAGTTQTYHAFDGIDPSTFPSSSDGVYYAFGAQFYVTAAASITEVGMYLPPDVNHDGLPFYVSIWTFGGIQVTPEYGPFTASTTGTWNRGALGTAFTPTVGAHYVAAFRTTWVVQYPFRSNSFGDGNIWGSGLINGPLVLPGINGPAGNGTSKQERFYPSPDQAVFPDSSFNSTAYFIDVTAVVTAAGGQTGTLTATGTGATSLSGSDATTGALAASGTGATTLTGTITETGTLAATGTGSTSLAGTVSHTASLAATATGSGALAGATTAVGSLSATATGASTITAGPNTVTGSLASTATATSALSSAVTRVGTLSATGSASATLAAGANTIPGSLAASASATQTINVSGVNSGSLASTATATTSLSSAQTDPGSLAATGTGTQILGSADTIYPSLSPVRTNLIPNPSANYSTTGWTGNQSAGTATVTRITGITGQPFTTAGDFNIPAVARTWDLLQVAVSNGSAGVLKAGQTYTLSIYIRNVSGDTSFGISIQDSNATNKVFTGFNGLTATTSWTRFNWTFTALIDSTAGSQVYIPLNAISSASEWQVAGVLLESGSTLGAYFDGDTPAANGITYGWAGTPGSSLSTGSLPQVAAAGTASSALGGSKSVTASLAGTATSSVSLGASQTESDSLAGTASASQTLPGVDSTSGSLASTATAAMATAGTHTEPGALAGTGTATGALAGSDSTTGVLASAGTAAATLSQSGTGVGTLASAATGTATIASAQTESTSISATSTATLTLTGTHAVLGSGILAASAGASFLGVDAETSSLASTGTALQALPGTVTRVGGLSATGSGTSSIGQSQSDPGALSGSATAAQTLTILAGNQTGSLASAALAAQVLTPALIHSSSLAASASAAQNLASILISIGSGALAVSGSGTTAWSPSTVHGAGLLTVSGSGQLAANGVPHARASLVLFGSGSLQIVAQNLFITSVTGPSLVWTAITTPGYTRDVHVASSWTFTYDITAQHNAEVTVNFTATEPYGDQK